jgi:hypothetical protein
LNVPVDLKLDPNKVFVRIILKNNLIKFK